MRISGKITIETKTADGLTIEWTRVTLTSPDMTSTSVRQMGAGETEGTAHKALDEALRMFRQVNGIKTSEMTAGEDGYSPHDYSRHGLPGGVAAR